MVETKSNDVTPAPYSTYPPVNGEYIHIDYVVVKYYPCKPGETTITITNGSFFGERRYVDGNGNVTFLDRETLVTIDNNTTRTYLDPYGNTDVTYCNGVDYYTCPFSLPIEYANSWKAPTTTITYEPCV